MSIELKISNVILTNLLTYKLQRFLVLLLKLLTYILFIDLSLSRLGLTSCPVLTVFSLIICQLKDHLTR